MVDFERLARPGVRELRAYDPGHDLVALRRRFAEAQLVELGSNENPYGASPDARQAILPRLCSSICPKTRCCLSMKVTSWSRS